MQTNYMSDDALADLRAAMEDASAFERGERRNLRVTQEAPRRPKAMSPKDIAKFEKDSTALKPYSQSC